MQSRRGKGRKERRKQGYMRKNVNKDGFGRNRRKGVLAAGLVFAAAVMGAVGAEASDSLSESIVEIISDAAESVNTESAAESAAAETGETEADLETRCLEAVRSYTQNNFCTTMVNYDYDTFSTYIGTSNLVGPIFDNEWNYCWQKFYEAHGAVSSAEAADAVKDENGYAVTIELTGEDGASDAMTVYFDDAVRPMTMCVAGETAEDTAAAVQDENLEDIKTFTDTYFAALLSEVTYEQFDAYVSSDVYYYGVIFDNIFGGYWSLFTEAHGNAAAAEVTNAEAGEDSYSVDISVTGEDEAVCTLTIIYDSGARPTDASLCDANGNDLATDEVNDSIAAKNLENIRVYAQNEIAAEMMKSSAETFAEDIASESYHLGIICDMEWEEAWTQFTDLHGKVEAASVGTVEEADNGYNAAVVLQGEDGGLMALNVNFDRTSRCISMALAEAGDAVIDEAFIEETGTYPPEQGSGTTATSADEIEITHYADIDIDGYGTVTVALDANAAPKTVANFVKLAEEGFYDGLTFHRIIDGFMIQGGDPNGDGTGGSEETIFGEFSENGFVNNFSHVRGAISMARSTDYDSASSQFFIVQTDSTFLDGSYAAFGYVTEGMDIIDQISADAEPTDDNGTIEASAQPVINSITIRFPEGATEEGAESAVESAAEPAE